MAARQEAVRGHLRLAWDRDRARAARRASRIAAARRSVGLLLLPTAFLTLMGLVMVLSASSVSAYARYGSSFVFFRRQLAYAAVGTIALLATARMRYRAWRTLAAPLLGATVVLLALVLHPAAGRVAGGSARWLELGPVTVQPSELAKLAVVAFAAALLERKWELLGDPLHLAVPLVPVVGLVCAMIYVQPDLGTTVIIAGTVFLLLFAAGARLRYLVASGGVLAALAVLTMQPYQRARLVAFLDPWADARNTGYQLIQSLIALASGGWFGVGLGASRQKWMYVPNAHTDFIFSILGEELGLVGALLVVAAFGALLYGGVRVALRAPDAFGRLLAAGIVSWLGLQTVVNLGAVTGLLPITGVPLPLLSYGGSSLVVSLAAIGILVSIARASARPEEVRPRPRSRACPAGGGGAGSATRPPRRRSGGAR
ncbi:MAG TPA: putative lipid II flippase FtsW [Actinomycetota bacterium]|nr:putative lipid II flippase FtsW [Actinomycetota bacterium]